MLQAVEPQKKFASDFLTRFLNLGSLKKKHRSIDFHQVSFTEKEISEIIEKIVKTRRKKEDVLKDLDKLSNYCNLQDLECFLRKHNPGILSIQESIDAFARNAEVFLLHADKESSVLKEKHVIGFVQSLLIALESFLDSLGLLTFFVPAVSHQELEEKNRQLTALMSFISMLSGTFIPIFGPSLGGVFVAGVCLSLLTLSMSYSCWKQVPIRLPKFENMSLENIHLQHTLTPKRLAIVDKIANALIASKNSKKQVLLLGSPGSGKTTIIKAFVERVYANYYPELEGFKVFYTDSASLLDNRDWVRPPKTGLEKISEMIQGVNQKMIFVFDQIHLLSFFYGKTFAGDQLTSMLDNPSAHFPHVIGSINTDQYLELKEKYPSFLERFSVIKIDSLEDEDVILGLKLKHLQNNGDCYIDEGVFEHLIVESKKKWKSPQECNKMLEAVFLKCQHLSSVHQKSPFEVELLQTQELLQKHQTQLLLQSSNTFSGSPKSQEVEKIREKLIKLQSEAGEFLKEKQRLFQQRNLHFVLKKQLYEMSINKNIHIDKSFQTMFFLLEFLLLPELEKSIKKTAKNINCDIAISKKMVDEVIKNMEA